MNERVLSERPNAVQIWMAAIRPATLSASLVPVAVGTAIALRHNEAKLGVAVACALGALFIQIVTNLANDLFDFRKGADTDARLGPTRAVQAGLLSERAVMMGTAVAALMATICGLYLVGVAGWPVVVIGLASLFFAVAYTAGPFPLAYTGLGDIFVIIFFGFVAVCGTAFCHMLDVPAAAWWASIPIGSLSAAILVVNNLRDQATDAEAQKRTLVVRFGRRFGLGEYYVLLGLAYLACVGLWAIEKNPLVLLPLVSAPVGLLRAREVSRAQGQALNPLLGKTAKLLLIFGLLLSAAFAAMTTSPT